MIELAPDERLISTLEKNYQPLDRILFIAMGICPHCDTQVIIESFFSELDAYEQMVTAKKNHCSVEAILV